MYQKLLASSKRCHHFCRTWCMHTHMHALSRHDKCLNELFSSKNITGSGNEGMRCMKTNQISFHSIQYFFAWHATLYFSILLQQQWRDQWWNLLTSGNLRHGMKSDFDALKPSQSHRWVRWGEKLDDQKKKTREPTMTWNARTENKEEEQRKTTTTTGQTSFPLDDHHLAVFFVVVKKACLQKMRGSSWKECWLDLMFLFRFFSLPKMFLRKCVQDHFPLHCLSFFLFTLLLLFLLIRHSWHNNSCLTTFCNIWCDICEITIKLLLSTKQKTKIRHRVDDGRCVVCTFPWKRNTCQLEKKRKEM